MMRTGGRFNRWVLLEWVLVFTSGHTLAAAPSTVGSPTKGNLDLPYDALGEDQDELDAPDILAFYGQGYEANAIVFVLDKSGSMDSNGRWELQTREVVRTIQEMSSRAQFGVVYYGSHVTAFRNELTNASSTNKAAAIAFIRSRQPRGDTCTGEGVTRALEIVEKASTPFKALIVTSDGTPDICSTGDKATQAQASQILHRTVAANPGKSVRIHSIWVGQQSQKEGIDFLRRLAEMHNGTFRIVAN